ncbi:hypothetical protein M405DRAFT_870053 [Rhizopogon salebrosus TDB-379]|nr:hypothetical protein M405DRAFT_870053 [Rhizopogon salebrosus TDB-379]
MISPSSPDAPYFDGSPEDLQQYLDHTQHIFSTTDVSDKTKIRYFIAYAARGAYDDALIWEDIREQHKGSYDDFIRAIIDLYFEEIPSPAPPPRSLASPLDDFDFDTASSAFASPIIEDIVQEHADSPAPPPTSLASLLGPNAHLYLSNDPETDDSASEIDGVPFVANILSLQLSTNALEQVALQDDSL